MHSPAAQKRERERGLLSASRTAAAIQLSTQLLLWIFFFGYDQTEQAVWQAMLMLFLPLAALWLVWKNTAADHPSARWWRLPLCLCLLMDAVFLLSAISGFLSQLVPAYPAWTPVLVPAIICWFTALRARPRGVQYGAAMLAVPLVALLIFGTVFLRASTRADRLWPILGDGLLSTAQSALTGAGAVWGVSLLFVTNGSKTARWALVPWGLAVLCALWFGFLNPWAAGDTLAVAEKMMGLARHAHSVILYEMTGIQWMILLPLSLTACFSSSGQLIEAAFPRFPSWAAILPVPAAAVSALLFVPEFLHDFLNLILPWRFAVSLICGLGLMITSRRRA